MYNLSIIRVYLSQYRSEFSHLIILTFAMQLILNCATIVVIHHTCPYVMNLLTLRTPSTPKS